MRVRFQADADLNLIIVFSLLRREPTMDFKTVVDELLLVWGASEAEEWINRISYVPL